jgi:hypothetical protein
MLRFIFFIVAARGSSSRRAARRDDAQSRSSARSIARVDHRRCDDDVVPVSKMIGETA